MHFPLVTVFCRAHLNERELFQICLQDTGLFEFGLQSIQYMQNAHASK